MLKPADKTNFTTLQRAGSQGDLALMECQRISDGKKVAVIVAVGRDGEDFVFTPLAVMIEGDPYADFAPPDPNNPDEFIQPGSSP